MNGCKKAAWFDRDPARRAQEQDAVLARFPQFEWGERQHPFPHASWRGELQPFPNLEHLEDVVAHLEARAPLLTDERGALSVPTPTHAPVVVPQDPRLHTTFLIEVLYLEPPAVPRIYALAPRIDARTFPDHPHLNRGLGRHHLANRLGPISDLCVFAPQDSTWSWDTHTAKDVLVWTAYWLGAHLIWQARGRKEADWPIPGAPHEARDVLRETNPSQPCPCGSGIPFGKCCRARALALARTG